MPIAAMDYRYLDSGRMSFAKKSHTTGCFMPRNPTWPPFGPYPTFDSWPCLATSMTMLWYGQSEVENAAQEVEAVINLARQRNMYQLPFG